MSEQDEYGDLPVSPDFIEKLNVISDEEAENRALALRTTEPLGYLEFLRLMADARLVLTDSGGIQEETTALSVPCLTMRENPCNCAAAMETEASDW